MNLALFFIGLFAGYVIKDLLTTESQITYHIKRLRARRGSTINVESEAIATKTKKRVKRTAEQRKADREAKRNGTE